ncbi:MAG: hypothetical protein E5X80_28090 [Mesorhizobium sp.]|uniref:hypothetical protein n=1 Tax=Mesorhizobium sp. TaxID=1871066 RepID=UPI000FE69F64|nr:hypothetical protein [Mesorhizobium sp.]RWM02536.1 MAG: hypothetical protein EOR71_28015 [Mesorhizobium sp.]TIO48455.1 MAG: hypothetical protein E5X78_29265 [Mesorhizobium sp.]TIO56793.1 MAG: hypothetical protein E5X79_29060 [Mesorhizobium sp.]TJV58440.1 MAG: hypothetical protein E5X80_28090 [Mesorhizobium sp.]
MAIMRGVENEFAMMRPAHHGLVIASDAQGRVVAMKEVAPTGLTMVVTDLSLGPGPTLYTRIGDLFARLCVASTLSIAILSMLKRRRAVTAVPAQA